MTISIDRRTFLHGLGAAITLPALEIMRPANLANAWIPSESAHPVRMAYVFFPNGAIMPSWKPEGKGDDYKLSDTISKIERHRQDFNVITGLAQDNGRSKGDGAGDHARCASTFLTGEHPVKSSDRVQVGISVDQAAAQHVGHLTRLPSLELGIERGKNAGSCDSGYSCAYSANISWKTPTTPTAKEINPRQAFERLFGSGDEKTRKIRMRNRKSILDIVASDANRLKQKLGQTDRQKLDEYFTSIRDIEQRIERAENAPKIDPPDLNLPAGVPSDLQEHIRLMFDILVVAFETDATRISTFMLANAGSNRSYTNVGVKQGHHSLSHHRNNEEWIDHIRKIDGFLIEQYGYFLDRLKATKEGEGNLLDNSMIVYGSGLSDGNRHQHDDLPLIMAGNAGGSISTGRHLQYDVETPMNNLFLSMLDRVGARVDSIGDSNSRLDELS
ncbi:MAG: DUF1552 domain-containing protein [Planctomycetaceae bacterium]|nr:DUF1552 domain-containing protein [Planctomycetaceae bacterium]